MNLLLLSTFLLFDSFATFPVAFGEKHFRTFLRQMLDKFHERKCLCTEERKSFTFFGDVNRKIDILMKKNWSADNERSSIKLLQRSFLACVFAHFLNK